MKAALIAGVALIALAGCGTGTEVYQDAPVQDRNTTGADIINMPDGFSNVATKCDHGNRVYTIYHETDGGGYGAVAVVPADPTCKS